jgi:hypothetical protein
MESQKLAQRLLDHYRAEFPSFLDSWADAIADDPPAWVLGQDPSRCENCGSLVSAEGECPLCDEMDEARRRPLLMEQIEDEMERVCDINARLSIDREKVYRAVQEWESVGFGVEFCRGEFAILEHVKNKAKRRRS